MIVIAVLPTKVTGVNVPGTLRLILRIPGGNGAGADPQICAVLSQGPAKLS